MTDISDCIDLTQESGPSPTRASNSGAGASTSGARVRNTSDAASPAVTGAGVGASGAASSAYKSRIEDDEYFFDHNGGVYMEGGADEGAGAVLDTFDANEHVIVDDDEDYDGAGAGGSASAGAGVSSRRSSGSKRKRKDSDDIIEDEDYEGDGSAAPSQRAGGAAGSSWDDHDYGAGYGAGAASATKAPRRKLTAEDKAARAHEQASLKADKAAAREHDKQVKATAKAQEKEAHKLTKMEASAARGSYQYQEIALVMSADLHSTPIGEVLVKACASDGVDKEGNVTKGREGGLRLLKPLQIHAQGGYGAGAAASGAGAMAVPPHVQYTALESSVQWRRGVLAPTSTGQPSFDFSRATVEPFAVVVYTGKRWLEMLERCRAEATAHGSRYAGAVSDAVVDMVRGLQAKAPAGARLSIFVQGLKAATVGHRGAGAGSSSSAPALTLDQAEALHHVIYVNTEVDVKAGYEKAEQLAEALTRMTRAIAAVPYRAAPSALAVIAREHVNLGPDSKDASGARNLKGSWMAMLMMINGCSQDKAAAIASQYPTMFKLMSAYRRPDLAEKVKKELVADAIRQYQVDNGKKPMTYAKLSEDVYHFLTTRDPTKMIGYGS